MNRNMRSAIAMATAIAAIAAAAAIASGNAFADDITVETTPFVSTATRAEVQGAIYKSRDLARHSEWTLQHNQAPQVKSSYTPAQARAEYVAERDRVRALTAEDSGSNYQVFGNFRGSPTNVMGGTAR